MTSLLLVIAATAALLSLYFMVVAVRVSWRQWCTMTQLKAQAADRQQIQHNMLVGYRGR